MNDTQPAAFPATLKRYPARILRLPEVERRVGLKKSSIYARMANQTFPHQISLGDGGRAVGWLESSIDSWIEERVSAA